MKDLSHLSLDEQSKLVGKKVNERIVYHNFGLTKSHQLRKAYANLAYHNLPRFDRDRITLVQFISDILGHKDLDSSLRYTTVCVPSEAESQARRASRKKVVKRDRPPSPRGRILEEKKEPSPVRRKASEPKKADVFITLSSRDGEQIPIKKKTPTDGNAKTLDSLLEKVRELSRHKIKVTNAIMKKLGFNSTIILDPEFVALKNEVNESL
jgi:hypothetical protein